MPNISDQLLDIISSTLIKMADNLLAYQIANLAINLSQSKTEPDINAKMVIATNILAHAKIEAGKLRP